MTSKVWSFLKTYSGEKRNSDFAFSLFIRIISLLVFALFAAIVCYLSLQSKEIFFTKASSFFFSTEWDPGAEKFGALPFIFGTLASSLIAIVIAAPISLGAALFLTEVCPRKLRSPIGFLIQLLAAIPSVVYGLWGLFVLAPFVRDQLHPLLTKYLSFFPLFQGPSFGVGLLSAGLILSIIILPTITMVMREVFLAIPYSLREGALTLGATKWESIRLAVFETGISGIFSAIVLGLGRALGETMAVTMLIGNRPNMGFSIFQPSATMASVIANEYPEASSSLHLSALAGMGLLLLVISLVVNLLSRWIVQQFRRKVSLA